MNWKEFLRPTKAKLVLAALVYLLFIPIVQYCIVCFAAPCPGCYYISIFETFFNLHSFKPNWLYALAGLPVSYLATCLLAFFYSKYSKRKR